MIKLLVIVAALVPSLVSQALPDDVILARNLEQAYLSNRSSFHFGSVTFDDIYGKAETYEDAIGDRWSVRVGTRGSCVFDGGKIKYEDVFSLDDMVSTRTQTKPRTFSSLVRSNRFLSDGATTLYEAIDPNEKGAKVTVRAQRMLGVEMLNGAMSLPIDLGCPVPKDWFSRDIRSLAAKSPEADYELVSVASDPAQSPSSMGTITVRVRRTSRNANA